MAFIGTVSYFYIRHLNLPHIDTHRYFHIDTHHTYKSFHYYFQVHANFSLYIFTKKTQLKRFYLYL